MARESVHAKLERVRAPRVHVTYDVEVGDAIEIKEIPFVMGVLADLSGKPEEPLPRLKERRFVEVTPDNFDSVLASMNRESPSLSRTNSAKIPMPERSASICASAAWRISNPSGLQGK